MLDPDELAELTPTRRGRLSGTGVGLLLPRKSSQPSEFSRDFWAVTSAHCLSSREFLHESVSPFDVTASFSTRYSHVSYGEYGLQPESLNSLNHSS